ncbi:hypothetical protein B6D60_08415 [candidate division KSB1 bacterium 4484_87]|nr:MAG: hypothetical protein B6D60_08415 [candidate division KSB1 bacterium 4484_87]
MTPLINLVTSIWKGVIGLVRLSFFLLVILIFAFSSGWLKIQCDPVKMRADIQQRIQEIKEAISAENQEDQNFESIQVLQRYRVGYDLLEHRIRAGERLIDLERIYGTSWRVIQKINNISDPRRLMAGQVILVPVKKGFG